MNKPSNINFGRLAFVLLIGGSLLYSFIISGYLEEETRRVADISIEYGFYAGYSLWVLGMVLSNILSINRITRHKYAGSKGLNTALQIWSQTLLGAGKASIVAPVKVYRELSAQGNLLVRLVSMVEVYIMRPIVSLAVLAAYALLSALFILPLSFFKLQTSRFSSEETNEKWGPHAACHLCSRFGYNKDFSFASPCFSLGKRIRTPVVRVRYSSHQFHLHSTQIQLHRIVAQPQEKRQTTCALPANLRFRRKRCGLY